MELCNNISILKSDFMSTRRVISLWFLFITLGSLGMLLSMRGISSTTGAIDPPFLTYLKNSAVTGALVAYSPLDYDPRSQGRRIPSLESLRADLRALRSAFNGLIVYECHQSWTPMLVAEAKQMGFSAILLGIWDPRSEEEISAAATLIRDHHRALALAICLGNEGLNFNRYNYTDLTTAVRWLKELLPGAVVPVCTSEPLGQYGEANLMNFGDFLAPNIHPVFDQSGLGPVEAAAWVRERAKTLAEKAQKPVLVKETGFPHGGGQKFSPEVQEKFWTAYLKNERVVHITAQVWVAHLAAFEAFDLKWKEIQTGLTIEGAWGLLDKQRKPYPAYFAWKNGAWLR
jgi:exo-beta-1,3-glucanase (GH17 family)